MSKTLNGLVREQILAEGPDSLITSSYEYIDNQLNEMSNVELLERISDALYQVTEGLSVRLGI